MINTSIKLLEGNTQGLKAKLYDVNSNCIVPTSMSWALRNSLNTVIATGSPSALSSETSIVFSHTQMIVSSGETKANIARVVDIEVRYTSSIFGANAVFKDSVKFTLVNNPF